MRSLGAFVLCYIVVQVFEPGQALKCRSGNRQTDEQYQKILQICRKRYSSGNGNNEDSSSNDGNDSSSDSNSNEDIFHNRFFAKNSTYHGGRRSDNRNDKYHNENDQQTRRSNGDMYSYNSSRGNYGDTSGGSRASGYNIGSANSNRGRYGNNRANARADSNNNNGEEEVCVVQCLFNELNIVDRKGFPEMDSVIQLMEQNIQNPELRDFIEESVTECFHYLNSNFRREKCEFSQRLLICMADKGKERCEDWDD
ncbi:hypothetical protein KM043_008649 [Ampulex compressa]|nr:hypothetical protein KM043_008649 [Ampulex compressa]